MSSSTAAIEAGQFDDAPGEREGNAYIDTYDASKDVGDALDWSDSPDEEDEDEIEDEYDDSRVEDEDWENAERDFTKQYNRLRQHAAVRSGNAQGQTSALNHNSNVAALPAVNHPKQTAVLTKVQITKDRTSDQLAALSKFNSRLAKIDTPYVMGVGVNRKGPSAHANLKDKSDRATNEQVLDPRTRLILFKMIGRGLIHEVNGCVSTGKEANVYHAVTPEGKHLAVKIYKTSILVFKDRDKYVTGEYRFRRGYSKNPRKMVRLWAEKEMRNLKRLVASGINAPDPLEVRENVLVMTFVGDNEGWASPRLKDASLPQETLSSLYEELVLIVRRLFHTCKLVHADLSEYNILYHEGHLWIIDVSQSVEHDHPAAFDFLRNDIKNVEEFFGRLGVKGLGIRRCFEFVIKEKLTEEEGVSDEQVLKNRLEENVEEDGEEKDEGKPSGRDAAHEDSIFMQSFIPRTLNEVYDPERDVEKLKRGDSLIYADAIGLVDVSDRRLGEDGTTDKTPVVDVPASKAKAYSLERRPGLPGEDDDDGDDDGEEDEDESDESDGDAETKDFVEKKPRGHRHEDKEAKKERKKQVKADNKEKRKQKMPKAEKKKIIKRTKGG